MPPPNSDGEVLGSVRLSKSDWVRILLVVVGQAVTLVSAGVGWGMSISNRMTRQEERWAGTTMLMVSELQKEQADHEARIRELERQR